MDQVLLLIGHTENRRLLAGALAGKYGVTEAQNEKELGQPFDLAIMDPPAMVKMSQFIQDRRWAESPVFLPFLLVAPPQDARKGGSIMGKLADELITAPIGKMELLNRVEILLRARRFSRESEDRYLSLAESNPAGVLIIQTGRIVYANPAILAMADRPAEEMIGSPLPNYIHREDRRKLLTGYNRLKAGQEAGIITVRISRLNGFSWGQVQGAPIIYRNKPAIMATILDVTERKKTEEKLRKSNRALKAISLCNQALVKAKDEKELIEEVCRAVVDVAEYRMAWVGLAEDDEGKTVHPAAWYGFEDGFLEKIRVSWSDNEAGRGPAGRAIRSGRTVFVNDLAVDPDFKFWRDEALKRGYASSISLPLKSGEMAFGTLNIYASGKNAFNQEERAFLEEMAGDLGYGIDTLRARAAQRQAEKENRKLEARLRQSQKMEAIGTLAGGIAHDFNNILTIINGYTELAQQETSKESPLYSNLEEVLKAGRRARDLVLQILYFSRRNEKELVPVSISSQAKEVLKFLKASAPSTIELRHHFTAEHKVMADPTQLHQVLMNLCTNSIQAMEEEGGLLEVGLSELELDSTSVTQFPELKPGRFVRLTVSDTGPGMSPEVLDRIFEPYFTTKGKSGAAVGGTGLGLAVVHGIIKTHGGTIRTNSEPGRGATFHIFLPFASVPDAPRADLEIRHQPQEGRRILLVDDEEAIVDVTRQMLERMNHRVTATTSAVEALKIFGSHPEEIDLVITDMTMPTMTGDKLAQKLITIRPDVPVVLCSGFNKWISAERARDIGIREYIMKPIRFKELSLAINKAINGGAGD